MMMNGCSTGWLPTHVRTSKLVTRIQNKICERGRKVIVRCLDLCRKGHRNNTNTEAARAITPPSLFGMERRIAYANRKYHSGLICGGVTKGLAGEKFSGSPSKLGENSAREDRSSNIMIKPTRSFREK